MTAPTSARHSWGERVPFLHKTERECTRCGIVKVTRHESEGGRDLHWVEWYRDGEPLESIRTPSCDARNVVPA